MKYAPLLATIGLLVAANWCPMVVAQTPDSGSSDSTSAIDLSIPAWAGVGHTTSGAGWDGVTHFEGFIPCGKHQVKILLSLSLGFYWITMATLVVVYC